MYYNHTKQKAFSSHIFTIVFFKFYNGAISMCLNPDITLKMFFNYILQFTMANKVILSYTEYVITILKYITGIKLQIII